jgi:hypothetical protein
MNTIRTDNASISGVWSRDLSAVAPQGAAQARASQAFGDFSAFAGDDARVGVSGRLAMDDAARTVAGYLTEARDNGFG